MGARPIVTLQTLKLSAFMRSSAGSAQTPYTFKCHPTSPTHPHPLTLTQEVSHLTHSHLASTVRTRAPTTPTTHHPHLHFRACKRTVPRSVVSPCCWLAPNASPCGTFVVCRRVGSRRRIHVGRYMSSDPRQSSSPATRNRLCATACCCSLHAEDCDFH